MNKILVLALLFTLSACTISLSDCTASTMTTPDLYIDTTSDKYEYNIEFDWTDDKEKPIEIPFKTGNGVDLSSINIIPFFVNASYGMSSSDTFYNSTDEPELKDKKGYDGRQVFYTFDYSVDSTNVLKATIKGDNFKANPNDVSQKFFKYFGWATCPSNCKGSTSCTYLNYKVSNILVTFNNGNYYSISKILLVTLALLFL